jgi:hypothetical protein
MMKYFYLSGVDNSKFGVAIAPKDIDLFLLPAQGEVQGWKIFEMRHTTGLFVDYMANDLGLRLCSPKLRKIIDETTGTSDIRQWLEVKIKYDDRMISYFILHFPDGFVKLNRKKTVYGPMETIIKAVFDGNEASLRTLFTYKGSSTQILAISEVLQKKIIDSECVGIEFEPALIG